MSGWCKADLVELCKEIQRDLTRAKAQLATVQRVISELPIPDEKPAFICPQCGVEKVTSEMMVDHLANVHGVENPQPVLTADVA